MPSHGSSVPRHQVIQWTELWRVPLNVTQVLQNTQHSNQLSSRNQNTDHVQRTQHISTIDNLRLWTAGDNSVYRQEHASLQLQLITLIKELIWNGTLISSVTQQFWCLFNIHCSFRREQISWHRCCSRNITQSHKLNAWSMSLRALEVRHYIYITWKISCRFCNLMQSRYILPNCHNEWNCFSLNWNVPLTTDYSKLHALSQGLAQSTNQPLWWVWQSSPL